MHINYLAEQTARLRELNTAAVHTNIELVSHTRAEDLIRPTPCAGWAFADLLVHMTRQHYGFAAAARGSADPGDWQPRALGTDPVNTYRESAEHLLNSFATEDLFERKFELPEFASPEPFPAWLAVSFHFLDYVVHAWDVAKTLDLGLEFDPGLLTVAFDIARIVPTGEQRAATGSSFAPEIDYSGESVLDAIMAHLGRSPEWPETTAA
ncbi:TIGR03086 family metal-binding protein [Sciscionella marina]|uniref:TIGR03086 family metal-binding protein n=1 Tax=Sciscionella marina TaxID=508770 RepID=UPI00036605CC|nr:TIGR03086 family metal-binding protein [Sciscionella marina]